jgi:predicted N-acyltransferase
MNDAGEAITLRIHGAIAEIAAEEWDACAGDINPTVSHVFLNAMEESGSVGARSGWAPQHLSFSRACWSPPTRRRKPKAA